MKLYNLLGSAVLALLFVCFLAVPQKVFAIDFNFFNFVEEVDYQVLSEFESKKILQDFPDLLYGKWTALKVSGYSDPKEETVICLLKQISMLSMWNYFFKDLPLDTFFNVAKESLDIARLIGTEDTSGMIGKLEKGTVNMAVNYLKEYFFKDQIKVSFGAMEMKYKTKFGDVDSPLQYIIMYKRIDDTKSKVVARIYSPKGIIPPTSRGSIGMISGFSNSLEYGQNISPFIVEIDGIMDDGLFGSYFWDKKNTTIKTIFPETVPDFGLKPKTWQEKYIINPIKNTINSFSGVFSFLNGNNTGDLTEYIFKDTTNKEAINKEVESMIENNALEKDYPVKEFKEDVIEKEKITENDSKIIKEKELAREAEKKNEEKVTPVVCSKSSQYVSSRDIIINEVAWMGGENSANDEWIELKNTSDKDINLKGWTLRDEEDQINIVFEDITVSKAGFLLLERTDDDSVSFKVADLIYKGSLSNSEEELYLFDNLCQLRDFVSGNPKWPAGDNELRKTMERNDDLSGWHTYSGNENNNIWGTPREANSSLKQEAIASVAVSTNSSSSTVNYGGGLSVPIVTYCSQLNQSVSGNSKVIINEVAWMGSENSANDEWIELKNVSDEPISLAGWQLLDAENIKIVFDASAIINPQGFYLLERTDDDSIPNIQMDKEYSGGLSNNNESLRLFNSSCQLMDEVSANPDWLAGDNELRKTMERNNDLNGWHTYFSESVDDTSGLWGTPRDKNSAEVVIEDPGEEKQPEEDEQLIDNSNHLLITEIQTGESGGIEYVEIYNQTENSIDLCSSEENCFYLSYYSPASEWYNPYRNWKFPKESIINSNSYYVIDIFGDSGDAIIGNGADWKVKSMEDKYYETGQIGNSAGSLSIFSNNPKYVKVEPKEEEEVIEPTDEEKTANTIALKIDTVSWKSEDISPIVKEGESFSISEPDKVIGRKWSNGKYRDIDNNLNDFQSENSSLRNHIPKIPEKIQDLVALVDEEQKNSVVLSWTAPFDEDTTIENLNYEIYYSRNNQIDDNNLVNIKEYTDIDIVSGENNKRSVAIKDIFYDSEYYFKIIAKDPENNISPLSEGVSFAINEANHQKKAPYYDFRRSGHSQFNGPVGTSFVPDVLIEGNQEFTFNNDFTSTLAIDENGTVYFWGSNNRSYDFYAYNSFRKKWSINCSDACGFYPSLGKDGTIYISGERSVYALSPSGKIVWKKDYARVFTRSIIIDSNEKIYFLATKEINGPSLISIDKNGLETELYDTKEILEGLNPASFTELVIDDLDNIYFSINDFVIKYSGGEIIKKQFFPKYEETYSGSIDAIAVINQLRVSFDGTLLLSLNNGRNVKLGETYPVLYAVDSNLSQILWFKDDYYGPIGFNEEEFYYSKILAGSYPMVWYLGAADISNGETKWERAVNGVSFIISDSLNRIYFTKIGGIFGYDSNNMPENMEEKMFYVSPGSYYGDSISIGNNKVFFSDTQRVYEISSSE